MIRVRRKSLIVFTCALFLLLLSGCSRFHRQQVASGEGQRIVCIGSAYNEMIYALGAQANLVGVDYSSTYPPAIKSLPTVGYHRALSAEGILSFKPTAIIHDNNIGPQHVVRQLQALNVPTKTFQAKDDSVDGAKSLLREMGAFFHKKERAEELCRQARPRHGHGGGGGEAVPRHSTSGGHSFWPRVERVPGGGQWRRRRCEHRRQDGRAGRAARWRLQKRGMQQMTSPEVIAESNPQVILMTEYGFDRLGSMDEAKTLPGVAETEAAKNSRIYRVSEHELMYFGPDTGESILKLAKLIHQ